MATSLPESLVIIVLTTMLLQAVRGQEIAQQHVVKEGDNVTMQWNFTIQADDRVERDGEAFIVQVTLSGSVMIPVDLKHSIQVTVGPGMSGLTVTLLNVTASQAGVYAFIRDGVAEPLQKQLVIVQGKPSPVEALTATPITSSAVTLTWKDGFDGGLRQTFSVDYRPHGSQEWTEAVASISGSPVTVENLEAGIMYHFRVHSHNELGRSVSVEVEATTASGSNNLGLIIGVVIGVAVLIAVVIGVVIWKLRNKRPGLEEEDSSTRDPPGDSVLYRELNT